MEMEEGALEGGVWGDYDLRPLLGTWRLVLSFSFSLDGSRG